MSMLWGIWERRSNIGFGGFDILLFREFCIYN